MIIQAGGYRVDSILQAPQYAHAIDVVDQREGIVAEVIVADLSAADKTGRAKVVRTPYLVIAESSADIAADVTRRTGRAPQQSP